MIKLRKIEKYSVKEAKQVGNLYHVCTIDSVADYISKDDTLSGSGKYVNYLLKKSDVISLTRNKGFVVATERNNNSTLFVRFVIDGDKLSENHKIIPYNDLAYDSNGKLLKSPSTPENREQEEVVIGKIKHFSRYVKCVEYCMSDSIVRNKNALKETVNALNNSYSYLKKFPFEYKGYDFTNRMNDLSFIIRSDLSFSSLKELSDFLNCLNSVIQDDYSEKELLYVCEHSNSDFLDHLISLHFLPNHLLYSSNLKILTKYGGSIDPRYIDNHFMLFDACAENDFELVKILVDLGADINKTTSKGDTPIDWTDDNQIRKYLRKFGAKPNE